MTKSFNREYVFQIDHNNDFNSAQKYSPFKGRELYLMTGHKIDLKLNQDSKDDGKNQTKSFNKNFQTTIQFYAQ